ncbi:MAG: hypothetical protein SWK76_12115 [Actinomycetota bacterium]|nr:hypothetical protein [Actinomycetota bacterium]
MARLALAREFFCKRGYIKVRFYRIKDRKKGRELFRVKGGKSDYRFRGEIFDDLYSAQRYVADRIAEMDAREEGQA